MTFSLPPERHLLRSCLCFACAIALLFILMNTQPACASETNGAIRNWMDGFLESMGSGDDFDPEKLIDFGFLPGPFYTPEMKLGLGLAAVGLYSTNREDEQERISTISISGFASVTSAIGLKMVNQTFFDRDQVRLFVDGIIFDAPEKYWGIGYDQNSDDDNREDYTNITYQISPRVYYRLFNALHVGTGWDYIDTSAKDTEAGGLFFQDNPHGTDVQSSGYSLHIMSDTRDFIPNPYKGHFLNLDFYDYKPSFGSDSDYSVTEFTGNKYWATQENNILAFQVFMRSADDDVPWNRLSKIGGAFQMRGYWEGRYRDKKMITTQLEYRRNLDWRHGVVAWIGAGAIAPTVRDFDSNQILPNAGIGYRLAFKYRSNVRLDLGFGKNEIGFYFNVNEAF